MEGGGGGKWFALRRLRMFKSQINAKPRVVGRNGRGGATRVEKK